MARIAPITVDVVFDTTTLDTLAAKRPYAINGNLSGDTLRIEIRDPDSGIIVAQIEIPTANVGEFLSPSYNGDANGTVRFYPGAFDRIGLRYQVCELLIPNDVARSAQDSTGNARHEQAAELFTRYLEANVLAVGQAAGMIDPTWTIAHTEGYNGHRIEGSGSDAMYRVLLCRYVTAEQYAADGDEVRLPTIKFDPRHVTPDGEPF